MNVQPLAVLRTGLVTSVGLSAAASCAAVRAKISNPTETRFIDTGGEWILGHSVPLEMPWRGLTKLAKMAAMAIEDCLRDIPRQVWSSIPLLLCVAEMERPGRYDDLDNEIFGKIQDELNIKFGERSAIIPRGHVSVGTALLEARKLVTDESRAPMVLIAATDSFLSWPTLSVYERGDRLLTPRNSNGFLPGEGAGALLIGPHTKERELVICGLGFANESSTIDSEQPMRGEGLALAMRNALNDAGCALHDLDFRITDLSGEQYYFKEAALALARLLRPHREDFDVWHPAECIGETGAVSGLASLAVAEAACRKGYGPGPGVLCHAANDSGQRVALVLRTTTV
jgi:3-oxoacyl-[acyl-carrier-protein] synthase-1